jgi:hypothetical protein
MVSHFSDYVLREAGEYSFRVVTTDVDFERTIAQSVEALVV